MNPSSSLASWDEASITDASRTDSEWEDAMSMRSVASAPVGGRGFRTRNNRRTRELQFDLYEIQAAIHQERDGWNSRNKTAIAFFVTVVMMLATVRVHTDQSRMTLVNYTGATSSLQHKKVLTSEKLRNSYQRAGFSSQSLDEISISKSLRHLANVSSVNDRITDVPFFFHVPRAGGSTMKDILGGCYGLTEATDVGGRGSSSRLRSGGSSSASLEVVHSEDGASYVNVDTSTPEGIQKSKDMGLVESGLAQVIISQHLHPASTLFNDEQKGRCFTMIRHPIERAVSMFHYLGVAKWEPTYDPSLAYISIEMYARSKRAEHNWMVRFLSNELERDLNEKHLRIAKEVLRQKCLVGLLDRKDESFRRFEDYFGWGPKNQEQLECRNRLLHWGWSNKHAHPTVEEGSVVWDLLYKKNEFDMQLYEYAQQLYEDQAQFLQRQQEQAEQVQQSPSPDRNQQQQQPVPTAPAQGEESANTNEIVQPADAGERVESDNVNNHPGDASSSSSQGQAGVPDVNQQQQQHAPPQDNANQIQQPPPGASEGESVNLKQQPSSHGQQQQMETGSRNLMQTDSNSEGVSVISIEGQQ